MKIKTTAFIQISSWVIILMFWLFLNQSKLVFVMAVIWIILSIIETSLLKIKIQELSSKEELNKEVLNKHGKPKQLSELH